MTAPVLDPGHLLPDEDWAAVVAEAERELGRITAGHRAPEELQVAGGRYGTGALAVSGQVHAPRNGGRRAAGAPTFGVIHSAETPLRAGYAASIARYFRDKAPTSCHYMTDPAETWGVLDDALIAWHCGNGNPNSLALEQAGYASMSRAQWLVPDGYAQMARNAQVMRAARQRYGIGLYMMTDAQLLAAHRRQIVGGWATHDQCRRVLRGTTHTDPGGGFPLDVQLKLANGEDQAMADLTAAAVEQIKHAVAESPIGGVVGSFPRIPRTNDVRLWQLLGPLVKAAQAAEKETTQRLASRVGKGKRDTTDTVLGFAIEAHAVGYAVLDQVTALRDDVAKLPAALAPAAGDPVAPGAGLSAADVDRVAGRVVELLAGRLQA